MRILKIGGNELADPNFLPALAGVIANANEPMAIVHGGGAAIAALQAKLGLDVKKVDGLRVTDAASLEVAQMVLSGQANKSIVASLLAAGVDAVGLSGVDGGLFRCVKKVYKDADLGLVGQVDMVRTELVEGLAGMGLTAVISPISIGHDNQIYNVNGDEAAGALAGALKADLIDFVSNVPGVLHNNEVIPQLTLAETEKLINDDVIFGGMVPKVRAALAAVEAGVKKARIVNLAGLSTNGGTIFVR
ncbi:MAG: acetylglutamate kinase [Chloroflexota bacterium]